MLVWTRFDNTAGVFNGFFFKKPDVFPKMVRVGILLWNAYQMKIFHENVFFPHKFGVFADIRKVLTSERMPKLVEDSTF